ncbi:MAG: FKBP-type peptidyl-prolyl cis-trans isomerase [Gammaproteobacteria bacterium]|jgi:FKBP-type peptidyl-prolyl cis-trans isomerase FklB
MKLSIHLPAVLLCSLSTPLMAAEALNFENETTRINYSLGHQIGGDFKRQGVEMDAEAVVQGIRDALSGNEPQLTPSEMKTTLMELKKNVVADQRKRGIEKELAYLAEGKEFMEENAKKEGVVTTESGLQYKVIEPGSGKSPGPQDQVTVHYKGTFIDGKPFDSSYKKNKPATFRVNGVIKGWSEGLQLMKEGGKSQFFIPQNLAYGTRGPLAHRTLIFEVELLKVEEPPKEGVQSKPKVQNKAPAEEKAREAE